MRSEMNEFDHLILGLFKQQRERPEKHHYPQNVKQYLTDFLGISEQARKSWNVRNQTLSIGKIQFRKTLGLPHPNAEPIGNGASAPLFPPKDQ